MTVKEIKELLKNCDDFAEVYFSNSMTDLGSITEVESVEVATYNNLEKPDQRFNEIDERVGQYAVVKTIVIHV